ncbi:hypothetical protein [Streptomyces sp900116325]|uniref:hypothetical protein n=1 Tax=Streptomyces sp. 900116325 TaxID=3154295 RepID=UPI0033195842
MIPKPLARALSIPSSRSPIAAATATHEGPDPSHGGLTTHRGAREDCSGPDCGPVEDDAPTGEKYPCGLGVFCDTCGTTFEGDFIVTDTMTKSERLEVVRRHVRAKEGWQCDHTGDFCPGCCTESPANDLLKAADDLEDLRTAALGTSWRVAREQDTHPEGDGSYSVIGIEPTDGDADIVVFQDPDISEEDAAYIAAMGPDIAQHLVQLMRHEAVWFELPEAASDLEAKDNNLLAMARLINNRPR